MSKNLSRTLFYEFYKSDPNFIYESIEEYRNYKSDPTFADKTIEQYRRSKALQKKLEAPILQLQPIESDAEECFSEECHNEATATLSANEIEIQTVDNSEKHLENKDTVEENEVDEIQREIKELKVESMAHQLFERSLEHFWNTDDEDDEVESLINSKASSSYSSNLSSFTSGTELNLNMGNKKGKSKFKIPKSRSTINLNKVKSRYMDVYKK